MSAKRKSMMKAWNETYGLGGSAVQGITGRKKKRITEDDPQWNPKNMGNKRGETYSERQRRRRRQGVRRWEDSHEYMVAQSRGRGPRRS
jgi:hypothetical protein